MPLTAKTAKTLRIGTPIAVRGQVQVYWNHDAKPGVDYPAGSYCSTKKENPYRVVRGIPFKCKDQVVRGVFTGIKYMRQGFLYVGQGYTAFHSCGKSVAVICYKTSMFGKERYAIPHDCDVVFNRRVGDFEPQTSVRVEEP